MLDNLEVILRLELRNILLNVTQDPQEKTSFKKAFMVHSLRLVDGFTYQRIKSCPTNYKTEFLEIFSIDFDHNPSFKIKPTEDIELEKCLATFMGIWTKL